MTIKLISIAFIATLIVGLPVWLLISNGLQIQSAHLLVIVTGIFLLSLGSAISGSRLQKSPASGDFNSSDKGHRETGNVKWFNASKGFGFITPDNGDDIFVHFRSIRGEGHRVLRDGQRVEFYVSEGDKGLQAEDVSVIQ